MLKFISQLQEAFHYNPENELWTTLFNQVENMYYTQDEYGNFNAGEKTIGRTQLLEFYNRPELLDIAIRNAMPLKVEIDNFIYYASAIWPNKDYNKNKFKSNKCSTGFNLHFNTFRFNQIPNDSGSLKLHHTTTEQYQNLKQIYFVSINKI